MRCWNIQALDWNSTLLELSDKLEFSSGIHFTDQLCLQRGVLGLEWRRLHGVCGGQVQCVTRIDRVLGLRGGHVFYSIRSNIKRDVHHLSAKLLLAGDQFNLVKLHLQRRIDRSQWRPV
jgi:hypothetical protein